MSANTVDNSLGDLQPASFRGVPFACLLNESRFGRSIALHEYPFKDTQWAEDLGRGTRKFTIHGFLITDSLIYGGGNVIDQRDQLVQAAETKGAGTLIHPTLGRLQVSIPEEGLVIQERLDAGSYMEFILYCYETGERSFPSASADQDDDIGSAADDIDSAAGEDFEADAAGPLDFGSFVGSTAIQTATSWVGLLGMAATDATSIFNLAAALPGNFGRFFNGALSGFATTLLSSTVLITLESLVLASAQTRQAITNAGTALIAAAGSLDPTTPTPAARACVAQVVAAAPNPADAVRLMTGLANFFPDLPDGPSVIGQASAKMQTVFATMLRRTAMAGLVRAVAAYQPQSVDDADNVRRTVCDLLDAEVVRAGDIPNDASCQALTRARGAVAATLDTRGANLPPMRQFNFAAHLPVAVLAQRIYQDSTRADQLVAEANPVHPSFMPLSFKALSS